MGLTGVEVKRPKIVEELSIDLTTKHKEFRTDHTNGMAISTSGTWSLDTHAGPLPRSCEMRQLSLEIETVTLG